MTGKPCFKSNNQFLVMYKKEKKRREESLAAAARLYKDLSLSASYKLVGPGAISAIFSPYLLSCILCSLPRKRLDIIFLSLSLLLSPLVARTVNGKRKICASGR
jgi:hypothetical protein